ncbi:hypothetical protein HaLaN_32773, partial [Haematococcus lacustris]
ADCLIALLLGRPLGWCGFGVDPQNSQAPVEAADVDRVAKAVTKPGHPGLSQGRDILDAGPNASLAMPWEDCVSGSDLTAHWSPLMSL